MTDDKDTKPNVTDEPDDEDTETDPASAAKVMDEPKRFQVRYKDGGGEQVIGESVDSVRAARTKFWGDREVVFCEEIVPKEP